MMLRRSTFRVFSTFLVVFWFTGCAVGPESETGTLDPRLAWPCDRLILAWPADAAQLQKIAGANLTNLSDNGVSELRLSVMRCDPPARSRSGATPLLFAQVTVPVTADSVGLVITSVPEDGWWTLPHIIADSNTSELFTQLSYEVLAADISFTADRSDRESMIEVRLDFDNGHIVVAGSTAGEPAPHAASAALVVSSAEHLSAFFGKENAQRYTVASAAVEIEGETPLSTFDLPEAPATAVFDEALLRPDRIFWLLPVAE